VGRERARSRAQGEERVGSNNILVVVNFHEGKLSSSTSIRFKRCGAASRRPKRRRSRHRPPPTDRAAAARVSAADATDAPHPHPCGIPPMNRSALKNSHRRVDRSTLQKSPARTLPRRPSREPCPRRDRTDPRTHPFPSRPRSVASVVPRWVSKTPGPPPRSRAVPLRVQPESLLRSRRKLRPCPPAE
jgi:hypothetical protein